MTTALTPSQSDQAVPTPAPREAASRPQLRSSLTIGAHLVVDVISFVPISLMPVLVFMLDIPAHEMALLLGIGSISSGGIQPVVAWLSDKLDTRVIGTLGLIVACLAMGNLGAANSFNQLAILFALGTAGVGAFHPPAAAAVGRLAGRHRSKWLALFFLFGMVGGMIGNVFTPRFVNAMGTQPDGTIDTQAGLDALRWIIPVGIAAAVVLALSIHKVGHKASHHETGHADWDRAERRARWRAVTLLYFSNMMRFGVNMALVYLFIEWAEAHTLVSNGAASMTDALSAESSKLNGILQAAMQVGMGGGGLLLGFILAARFEKLVFFVLPALGALTIGAITLIDSLAPGLAVPAAVAGSVLAGLGFGAVIPVSLSLAQRMLPHRTSLASGLMLGGAWCFAFVGPLIAELVQNGLRTKESAPAWLVSSVESLPASIGDPLLNGMGLDAGFFATAGALFLAGLITFGLPKDLLARTHAH